MADEHAIFRDGLRKLLESEDDIKIVGEASNGNECVHMLTKLKPDILLLDLRMPGKDGLAVLEEANLDSLRGTSTGANKCSFFAHIAGSAFTTFYDSAVRPPKYCWCNQGEPNDFAGVLRPIHPSPHARQ